MVEWTGESTAASAGELSKKELGTLVDELIGVSASAALGTLVDELFGVLASALVVLGTLVEESSSHWTALPLTRPFLGFAR